MESLLNFCLRESNYRLTSLQLMLYRVAAVKRLPKGKVLFILHVMIGMLSSPLMQSEIIICGLVRKCVKLRLSLYLY